MKAKYLGFAFMCLIIIAGGCKHSPTETIDTDKPGRRDYSWTVDTLSFWDELFTLHDLWGANENDIWVIAYAPSTNHSLWHYDGNKWEAQTNTLLSSSLQSIYGFASNDIWIINDPGNDIFHYNGNTWSKVGNFKYPGYETTQFNRIWGPSSNEIYVVGCTGNSVDSLKSLILKYDGSNWQFMDIPELDVNLSQVRKSSEDNLMYFDGLNFYSTGYIYYIYTYDGSKFTKLYDGSKSMYVDNIRGNVYISQGWNTKKIYRYENNELKEWKNFSDTQYQTRIFGRSEIDFFTYGLNNTFLHYNGADLQPIYQNDDRFNGSFFLEKDVFLLSKGKYNYMIHGRLED